MVLEFPTTELHEVEHLFEGHKWLNTVIQYALREKRGKVYVADIDEPDVAFLQIGFVFLGGNPSSEHADQIIDALPPGPQLIVPTDEWASKLIDTLGTRVKRVPRVGFSYDKLNIEQLRALKQAIPAEFSLQRIDLEIARTAPRAIAPAIPFFFGSPESFIERGFGFCIKHGDTVVSTAMTAMPFEREFEIEVDTLDKPEYRRKGLATAVSAALIEHALLEGLIPIWDAANEPSKGLALKLGYSNPTPYDAFSKQRKDPT